MRDPLKVFEFCIGRFCVASQFGVVEPLLSPHLFDIPRCHYVNLKLWKLFNGLSLLQLVERECAPANVLS